MSFLVPLVGAAVSAVGGASTIGTVASLGAAGIGALGSIEQSKASAASAGYNAQVAQQNAQIATQNASFAGSQGQQEVAASGAQTKARIAATLANQGASGVDVNTGSDVNVRESEAKLGMLDALTIRSNAAKSAYGYQTQSVSDTGQAALLKSQQGSDILGGYLSGASNVLGGIGSAAKFSTYLSVTDPTGLSGTPGEGVGNLTPAQYQAQYGQ